MEASSPTSTRWKLNEVRTPDVGCTSQRTLIALCSAVFVVCSVHPRWLGAPLAQAASSGDMSRLEQLLSEDAGVVMKAAQSGEPGKLDAVHKAAARGHAPFLRRLFEAGARHDTKLSNGDTPLHLAVRAGQSETVKALVDRGADYTAQNDAGHDALYEAVTGRKSHCVLLLMQAGADYQDYVTSGKMNAADVENLRAGLASLRHAAASALDGTLGFLGADVDLADSDVSSDTIRMREKYLAERKAEVVPHHWGKVDQMSWMAQHHTEGDAHAWHARVPRAAIANPKQVCTDLLRESKIERRDLRKSLEARAHSSADIFVQAERAARDKRRMADDTPKPVSAAAAAEAERRVTQGLTCLRHGEKVKVRGMGGWRSGDPARALATSMAREARLDKLSGLDSPRRSSSAQSSPSFRRGRISAGLDSSYTGSPSRSPRVTPLSEFSLSPSRLSDYPPASPARRPSGGSARRSPATPQPQPQPQPEPEPEPE